jgi:hypothetical protein
MYARKWPLPLCVYSVDERSISVFFPKREHPREVVENMAMAKVVVERTLSAFFISLCLLSAID